MPTATQELVLLKPRPFARCSGVLILVPLLPKPAPLSPLPAETWTRILSMAMQDYPTGASSQKNESGKVRQVSKWDLALVSKEFKDLALPLLYAECTFTSTSSLLKFVENLRSSDQRWDSIRRIPYSTPGRWVQSVDLSQVIVATRKDLYTVDALLTTLFPLVPFLARLELSLSIRLSKRAMAALALREGSQNIRVLKGIKYDTSLAFPGQISRHQEEDPLTLLISCCDALEELELIGGGLDDVDGSAFPGTPPPPPLPPLNLPRLHTLTMLSMPSSYLLMRLLHTRLPSLTNLVITPYGDLQYPTSLVSQFLRLHGPSIMTLILHTPKSWPTSLYPPPSALLLNLPNVKVVSLENPLPSVLLPIKLPPLPNVIPSVTHPLESLWIPRPTAQFRITLEQLLPHLPALKEVRARDVRWVKNGISARALEAGFQGEMRAWKRILATRNIKMLDADGRPSDS